MPLNTLSPPQVIDLLRMHVEAGCNDTLADAPINRFIAPQLKDKPKPASKPAPKKAKPQSVSPQARTAQTATPQDAHRIAQAANSISALETALQNFAGCSLKETAKHTVFADGIIAEQSPRIMLVGDAPGADEDRIGKPLIGRSGQLLDTMLAAIGLARTQNLYITNVVAWRPAGERTPTPAEIAQCRPFVERHIELVKPDVLLLAGNIATKTLLNTQKGITHLHGIWTTYDPDGLNIRALPLFHPSYILRRPLTKKDMWADLCLIRRDIKF